MLPSRWNKLKIQMLYFNFSLSCLSLTTAGHACIKIENLVTLPMSNQDVMGLRLQGPFHNWASPPGQKCISLIKQITLETKEKIPVIFYAQNDGSYGLNHSPADLVHGKTSKSFLQIFCHDATNLFTVYYTFHFISASAKLQSVHRDPISFWRNFWLTTWNCKSWSTSSHWV